MTQKDKGSITRPRTFVRERRCLFSLPSGIEFTWILSRWRRWPQLIPWLGSSSTDHYYKLAENGDPDSQWHLDHPSAFQTEATPCSFILQLFNVPTQRNVKIVTIQLLVKRTRSILSISPNDTTTRSYNNSLQCICSIPCIVRHYRRSSADVKV